MLVVSDTTAITSLLKIGRAEILPQLFREVMIPEAVRDELLRYHATVPTFLKVKSVQDRAAAPSLSTDLGVGEVEAILLAVELRADALLIDDRRGRGIAEARGVPCLGLAGALLLARRRGIIDSVRGILDELELGARFYLSAALKRQLITLAGEDAV